MPTTPTSLPRRLTVARQELAWRHDVNTLDAYAWAMHVNGRDAEARKQIEVALAVGVLDAKILRHAGQIALQLGDKPAGEKYLKQSVQLHAPGSTQAQSLLQGVETQVR